jgi:hypothetical protein
VKKKKSGLDLKGLEKPLKESIVVTKQDNNIE